MQTAAMHSTLVRFHGHCKMCWHAMKCKMLLEAHKPNKYILKSILWMSYFQGRLTSTSRTNIYIYINLHKTCLILCTLSIMLIFFPYLFTKQHPKKWIRFRPQAEKGKQNSKLVGFLDVASLCYCTTLFSNKLRVD
jgi:hypothetical protein